VGHRDDYDLARRGGCGGGGDDGQGRGHCCGGRDHHERWHEGDGTVGVDEAGVVRMGVDRDWDREGRRRHEGDSVVSVRSDTVERRGGDDAHEAGGVGERRGGEATRMNEAARASEKKCCQCAPRRMND
jgi:hypothetical protein